MKRNTTIEKVKELKGKVPSSPGLDGGWGWIIIIGCSLIHLFFIGYVKSFGILFHLLIQKFVDSSTTQEIDVKSLSWIPAVHIFCLNFCSAPATLLMKRYGAKRMILIGTILVCTGIFSCGLVLTTPKLLFLTHGVIAGVGGGLLYTCSYCLISDYFKKKRTTAMSLASCVSGISGIIFPFIVKIFLKEYGLTGTFILTSAFAAHVFIAVCLFRPVEDELEYKYKLNVEPNVKELELINSNGIGNGECYEKEKGEESNKLIKKIIFCDENEEIEEKLNKKHKKLEEIEKFIYYRRFEGRNLSSDSWKHLFKLSLLTKYPKSFLLLFIYGLFNNVGYITFGTIFPSHASHRYHFDEYVVMFVSLYCAVDASGRFTLSIISYRHEPPIMVKCSLFFLVSLLMGVTTYVIGYHAHQLSVYLIAIAFRGMLTGLYVALLMAAIGDFVKQSEYGSALALIQVSQGIVALISFQIFGSIRDKYNSFDKAFFIIAIIHFIAMLFALILLISTWLEHKSPNSESE